MHKHKSQSVGISRNFIVLMALMILAIITGIALTITLVNTPKITGDHMTASAVINTNIWRDPRAYDTATAAAASWATFTAATEAAQEPD